MLHSDLHPDEQAELPAGELDPRHPPVLRAVLRSVLRYLGHVPTGRDRWQRSPPYGWALVVGGQTQLLVSRMHGVWQHLLVVGLSEEAVEAAVQALHAARVAGPARRNGHGAVEGCGRATGRSKVAAPPGHQGAAKSTLPAGREEP
jgi:hypothetical protein